MATVTAFIRTSKKTDRANVRFRLRDGRETQLFYKSPLEVNPTVWDAKKQEIKAKIVYDTAKRAEFNQNVANYKKLLLDVYRSMPLNEPITTDKFKIEVDKTLHPEKYDLSLTPQTFFEVWNEFLKTKKLAESRKRAFMVIKRALKRFELYEKIRGEFELTLDGITANTLQKFEEFLVNEHKIFERYPKIYEAVPETRTPKPRGQNTINGIFVKFRTFYIWAVDNGKTTNNPFRKYRVEESVYGTPYYISVDERNALYNADFSHNPQLATQRDIFVFQCLIGCRVGDLLLMTKANVINGAIEYVARKTKNGNPITVRVPLNSIAKEILERYKDYEGRGLLPFITSQRYNDYIKDMFEAAGITRIITWLNPTTREPEQRPINEVASSHLARRCFVGNLYRQVKDPNLVGALSGHKYGSKDFARYREIDENMKAELVKMLEQ
ncbi:MAG: phage integrase SAM-like domain-containing protein [Bacteroidales bacterium]|nr:phage integrase SAM-like domain-containing protein [Bacteroidales bacterium]